MQLPETKSEIFKIIFQGIDRRELKKRYGATNREIEVWLMKSVFPNFNDNIEVSSYYSDLYVKINGVVVLHRNYPSQDFVEFLKDRGYEDFYAQ